MSKKRPSYQELKTRLDQAESTLEAIRHGEIDILVTETEPILLRYKSVLDVLEQLRVEAERLAQGWQITFDAASDAIWHLDTELRILRSNKIAENIFLIPREGMVGKHCYEIVHKTMEPLPECPFLRMRQSMQRESFEMRHGDRWLLFTVDPILNTKKELIGAVHIARDITEIKHAHQELIKSRALLQKTLDSSIETIAKIVELRDPYTAGHQKSVANLAVAIAREMNLDDERISNLATAALIHDIGKIHVAADILSKPGKLSEIEFSLIRTHPQGGYDVIESMHLPHIIAQSVLQHHERLDGSGYPNQLRGDDISKEAKILAVADVVEAMASHRPYRPALGIDKALDEILKNRGKLYDPEVVDVCVKLFKENGFKFEE